MNNWISTSERLPEITLEYDSDLVLLVIREPDSGPTVYAGFFHRRYGREKNVWTVGDDCVPAEMVTHWMPLPAPPK